MENIRPLHSLQRKHFYVENRGPRLWHETNELPSSLSDVWQPD